MGQVIFMAFIGHLADSGPAKIFASDSSSASERPPLMVFKIFKIFFSLWSSSDGKHGGLHVLLIFSTTSSDVYAKVEPRCSLKLYWIFCVRRTKFNAFGRASNLAVSIWPFYAPHD